MSMFKKILGPFYLLCGLKRIRSHLFFREGNENYGCLSDEAFFETPIETIDSNYNKLRKLNNKKVIIY